MYSNFNLSGHIMWTTQTQSKSVILGRQHPQSSFKTVKSPQTPHWSTKMENAYNEDNNCNVILSNKKNVKRYDH